MPVRTDPDRMIIIGPWSIVSSFAMTMAVIPVAAIRSLHEQEADDKNEDGFNDDAFHDFCFNNI